MPREDRERLLGLAHKFGGHLGVKKMKSKLNRLFTWPGLSGDVTRYVSACQLCATHNKMGNKPVELQERPVVGEPFRSVAIDIVGPLPKGRGGAQYILTYSCMATRWPEAAPLKGVTAQEVAEAFVGIMCRTGLPDTI